MVINFITNNKQQKAIDVCFVMNNEVSPDFANYGSIEAIFHLSLQKALADCKPCQHLAGDGGRYLGYTK